VFAHALGGNDFEDGFLSSNDSAAGIRPPLIGPAIDESIGQADTPARL
jgi:hypothetical protein